MEACKNSGNEIADHFGNVTKLLKMSSGGTRKISDYALSRYACYLIVMNGDPRKEIIALGQTYFAIKTRQQELVEDYDRLSEDQKRLAIRHEMIEHNKSLAEAAQMAGITEPRDYAISEQRLSGSLWRLRSKRNTRSKGSQKKCKHTRPYGQHRACSESFPRHSDR